VLTLVGCVCWASVELVGRTIGPPYSTVQLVWTRYFMHLVFVLGYVAVRGRWRELRTKHPVLQFVRGSMMLAMPIAYIFGALRSNVSDVLGVFWLGPLLTLAAVGLLGRERVTARQLMVAGLVFAASVLALKPGVPSPTALVSGLAMAGTLALYKVLTRRLAHEGVLVALLSTSVSVFLCLSVPLFGVWVTPDPATLAKMAVVGVLGFTFLTVFDQALHVAPASLVAPVLGSQPVISVLLRSLHTGQWPDADGLAGAMALSAALLFLLRRTEPVADAAAAGGSLRAGGPRRPPIAEPLPSAAEVCPRP
jgi:drug/metabolite transporter (DMT)-like permease